MVAADDAGAADEPAPAGARSAGGADAAAAIPSASRQFAVRVAGFEGPFDLLLSLIARHRIEVTELALHVVTDDFIAHVRAQGPAWDLDEATCFLVIAATLLDLKAARLLPDGSVEDEEDLALLEARDLLFARLLQYRAFKEVAGLLDGMLTEAATRRPRDVGLEPWLAELLPEVLLGLGPAEFASHRRGRLRAAAAGAGHLGGARARPRGQRPGAGRDPGRAAAPARGRHVPRADRRRLEHAGRGRSVPGPVGALPRRRGDLRPGGALGDLSVRWIGPDDDADATAIADRAVTDEFSGVVVAIPAHATHDEPGAAIVEEDAP